MSRRRTLGFVALLLIPASLQAQSGLRGSISGFLGLPTVERQSADTASGSGTLVGIEGVIGLGPFELAGRYAQGSVSGDVVEDQRDLVEGEIVLRGRPLPYLWIGIGPYARSYVFETLGTERWLTWEARLGFESALGSDMLRAHLDVAYALGGSADPGGSLQGARRVEGGIGVRLPRTPIELGAAYRIEQADIENQLATDIMEQLVFRVTVRL
jgi:hypothetical protein